MIRINLLPQARKATRVTAPASTGGGAGLWLVIYLVGAVVWSVGLGIVYFVYMGELEEQQRKNTAIEQQIQILRKKSERLDEVKAQLERSKQLEQVVSELDKARTGPTRVLDELSDILSANAGPTIDPQELEELRRDNPLAGFNRAWDVRRLWVTSFHEENRRCRIQGKGKTNEDVAEFLRRLALSELFDSVALQRTQMESGEDGLKFIGFELTCQVRY